MRVFDFFPFAFLDVLHFGCNDLFIYMHKFLQEYMEEKATLQSTVYEQMTTISSLKSQIESAKHGGGTASAEPNRVEQLQEQIDSALQLLDTKEQEVIFIRSVKVIIKIMANIWPYQQICDLVYSLIG